MVFVDSSGCGGIGRRVLASLHRGFQGVHCYFSFFGVLYVKRPGELVFPECSRCVYVLYLAFD
jgi:hypothetical protein